MKHIIFTALVAAAAPAAADPVTDCPEIMLEFQAAAAAIEAYRDRFYAKIDPPKPDVETIYLRTSLAKMVNAYGDHAKQVIEYCHPYRPRR